MRKLGAALSAGFTAALLLAGNSVPVPTEPAADAQFRDVRLTHILGLTVEDPNAQELGEVKDLVLNVRASRVECVIVTCGGFLGLGARERAVPAQNLSAATILRGTLSANLPKAGLEKAPGFANANEALAHPLAEAGDRGDDSPPGSHDKGSLQSARGLLGKVVFDAEQQKVGAVTDFLVDLSGQKPLVAIVCSRRFLYRDLRCAVPLPLLGLVGDKLVLGTSRQELERAPWFTERAWQTTTRHQAPAIYRVASFTQR